jgi:hypothetical protein
MLRDNPHKTMVEVPSFNNMMVVGQSQFFDHLAERSPFFPNEESKRQGSLKSEHAPIIKVPEIRHCECCPFYKVRVNRLHLFRIRR